MGKEEVIHGSFRFAAGLTPGKAAAGGLSNLLFDSDGKLVDHATFIPDIPDDSETVNRVAVAALVATGVVAAVAAAPHVKRRWKTRRARRKVVAQPIAAEYVRPAPPPPLAPTQPPPPTMSAGFAMAVDTTLEDCRTNMSRDEAARHLMELLAAAAIMADKIRLLSNARIVDDPELPVLTHAMAKLATQDVTDSINRMLASGPPLTEDQASIDLLKVFGGGRVVNGHYVPMRNAKIQEALRLPIE